MLKETTLQVTEIQFPNAQLLPEIIKLLNEGHTVTLQLRGFSMRPFLEDKRDKALLAKREIYNIGEPVLAEISPRHYVLHRIIKIEGEDVTLKGDGNLTTESCKMKDIKAIAVGFYRKAIKHSTELTAGNGESTLPSGLPCRLAEGICWPFIARYGFRFRNHVIQVV